MRALGLAGHERSEPVSRQEPFRPPTARACLGVIGERQHPPLLRLARIKRGSAHDKGPRGAVRTSNLQPTREIAHPQELRQHLRAALAPGLLAHIDEPPAANVGRARAQQRLGGGIEEADVLVGVKEHDPFRQAITDLPDLVEGIVRSRQPVDERAGPPSKEQVE